MPRPSRSSKDHLYENSSAFEAKLPAALCSPPSTPLEERGSQKAAPPVVQSTVPPLRLSRSNSISKNDTKIDPPLKVVTPSAELRVVWAKVSEDFMGNGWISSKDISWLTLADLKRCDHYDNLVQDEFESYEDIEKRWKAWDDEDHDTLEVHDGI